MGYKNPAMDALIDKARFSTGPEYEAAVKGFIDMAFEEVPRVPIYQPLLNVAMQKNVTGYRYWFHRQLDYRQLARRATGEPCSGRSASADLQVPLTIMTRSDPRSGAPALRRHAEAPPVAAGDGDPEHRRGRHRHLHADAAAAGRSGGLLRGAGGEPAGDRRDQDQARARQVAARAVRRLSSSTWRTAISATRSAPASRWWPRSPRACRPRPSSRCSP